MKKKSTQQPLKWKWTGPIDNWEIPFGINMLNMADAKVILQTCMWGLMPNIWPEPSFWSLLCVCEQ